MRRAAAAAASAINGSSKASSKSKEEEDNTVVIRGSGPQVGERVILLDSKMIRSINPDYVGKEGTIQGVKTHPLEPDSYYIAVDGQGRSEKPILVDESSFLSSTIGVGLQPRSSGRRKSVPFAPVESNLEERKRKPRAVSREVSRPRVQSRNPPKKRSAEEDVEMKSESIAEIEDEFIEKEEEKDENVDHVKVEENADKSNDSPKLSGSRRKSTEIKQEVMVLAENLKEGSNSIATRKRRRLSESASKFEQRCHNNLLFKLDQLRSEFLEFRRKEICSSLKPFIYDESFAEPIGFELRETLTLLDNIEKFECGTKMDYSIDIVDEYKEVVLDRVDSRLSVEKLGNLIEVCIKDENISNWYTAILQSYDEENDQYLLHYEHGSKRTVKEEWISLENLENYVEVVDIVWILEANESAPETFEISPVNLVCVKSSEVTLSNEYCHIKRFDSSSVATILKSSIFPFQLQTKYPVNKKASLLVSKASMRRSIMNSRRSTYKYSRKESFLRKAQSSLSNFQWIGQEIQSATESKSMTNKGVIKLYNERLDMHLIAFEKGTFAWSKLLSGSVTIDSSKTKITESGIGKNCWFCFDEIDLSELSNSTAKCICCARICHTACLGYELTSDDILRCADCMKCCNCRGIIKDSSVSCDICQSRYHLTCIGIDQAPKGSWICDFCIKCRNCGASESEHGWFDGYSLCHDCYSAVTSEDWCSICISPLAGEEMTDLCVKCSRKVHVKCMRKPYEELDTRTLFCRNCSVCALSDDVEVIARRLQQEDKFGYFANPVSDLEAPDYSKIIKTPMDLSTIEKRVNCLYYDNLQTFQEDVLLLWRNALVYNQPTSPVYKFAAKLQNVTDVLFKGLYSKYKVACIEDKAVFAKVNEAGEAERSEANQDNVGAEEHLESAALKSSWFDQNQILIAKGYEMMDLCVVCSSRGSDVDLIYCSDCGQCFHYYCLGIGIDAGISLMFHESIDSNEVGKNSSPKFALAKSGGKSQRMRQLKSWRCPNCTICEKCGRADKSNQLLQCDTCDSGIHLSCHRPALSKVPDQGYRCEKCVKRLRCRSCDINLPYSASAVQKWRFFCSDSNFWSLCGKCVSGYQERKFCPICLMVWKDSDGDMICCDQCDMWIHSKCDVIVEDDLDEMSTSKYFCPSCRKANSSADFIEESSSSSLASSSREASPSAISSIQAVNPQLDEKDIAQDVDDLENVDLLLTYTNILELVQSIQDIRDGKFSNFCNFEYLRAQPAPARRCVFCELDDESNDNCGRLLFVSPSYWIHAHCAIWSSDVFETNPGELSNIEKAMETARLSLCNVCHKPGATIICCSKECGLSLHFGCARKSQFTFMPDCSTFCSEHKPKSVASAAQKALNRARICRKLILNNSVLPDEELYCRVGSLTVFNFGSVSPEYPSLNRNGVIAPLNFSSCRIWWSYKNPGFRTAYECSVVLPRIYEGEENDSDFNSRDPEFVIIAFDDPENPIRTDSASDSWNGLVKRLKSFKNRNSKRQRSADGEFAAFELNGNIFFGFGLPAIQSIILSRAPEIDNHEYETNLEEIEFKQEFSLNDQCKTIIDEPSSEPFVSLRTSPFVQSKLRGPKNINSAGRRTVGAAVKSYSGLSAEQGNFSEASIKSLYRKMKDSLKPIIRRSNIHGFGLFATQKYERGDIVIEFIGEIIRSSIADIREKTYEKRGMGSCYMFRVDDDNVIDATDKGNITRYINHSCDPNCFSKVISIDSEKKIVIIAKKEIFIGDELSYDYQFEFEENGEKLPCKCGAPSCIGRLN